MPGCSGGEYVQPKDWLDRDTQKVVEIDRGSVCDSAVDGFSTLGAHHEAYLPRNRAFSALRTVSPISISPKICSAFRRSGWSKRN